MLIPKKTDIFVFAVFLVAVVCLPASAQIRRINLHTTSQTLAMTDIHTSPQVYVSEIIEAYDCESVDVPPTYPGG